MITIDCQQRSELWFSERLGKFTASKFATLMSGKSTQGYKDLITDVACELITKEVEESYMNDIMQRGIDLEPEARKLYEAVMETEVEEVGLCLSDDVKLQEWVAISPDGIRSDGNLIEIKCPLRKTHMNYILKNVLPNTYKWQVQGQLFVTGAEFCDFMSYYPGMKPFIIRVFPDKEMHKQLELRMLESIEEVKHILGEYEKYNHDNEIEL